jgi:hypothetical protein
VADGQVRESFENHPATQHDERGKAPRQVAFVEPVRGVMNRPSDEDCGQDPAEDRGAPLLAEERPPFEISLDVLAGQSRIHGRAPPCEWCVLYGNPRRTAKSDGGHAPPKHSAIDLQTKLV